MSLFHCTTYAQKINGSYSGNNNGERVIVRFFASEMTFSGTFEQNNAVKSIAGKFTDSLAIGDILNADSTLFARFEASPIGRNIIFKMSELGMPTIEMVLNKKSNNSSSVTISIIDQTPTVNTDDGRTRDVNFVGLWMQDEKLESPEGQSNIETYYLNLDKSGKFEKYSQKRMQDDNGNYVTVSTEKENLRIGTWYNDAKSFYFLSSDGKQEIEKRTYFFHNSNLVFKKEGEKFDVWYK